MQIDRRPNRGPYVAALICLLTLCLTIPLYWQSKAEFSGDFDSETVRAGRDGLASAMGGDFVRFDRYPNPIAVLPEYGMPQFGHPYGRVDTLDELLSQLANERVRGANGVPDLFNELIVVPSFADTRPTGIVSQFVMESLHQAGRNLTQLSPGERIAPIAARITQGSSTHRERSHSISTHSLLLTSPNDRIAMAPSFETPPQAGQVDAIPSPWCSPTALIEQLEVLGQNAYSATWARQAIEGLRVMTDARQARTDVLEAQFRLLQSLTAEALQLAEAADDDCVRAALLRAHWGLTRRLECWSLMRDIVVASLAEKRFAARESWDATSSVLAGQASEPAEMRALSAELETYEQTRTPRLARAIVERQRLLAQSNDARQRELAGQLEQNYRNANVRVALSAELLDRFVAQQHEEISPVREWIAGTPVRGQSYTSSNNRIRLEPDATRWNMDLASDGTVNSQTVADAGQVKLNTCGTTDFTAEKSIIVDPNGVQLGSSTADAHNYSQLMGIQSGFDWVPVVNDVVRTRAIEEYHRKQPLAQAEIECKVARRIEQQLDERAGTAVDKLERQLEEQVRAPLKSAGVDLTTIEMSTTAKRVIARLRVAGDEQLAAHTPRPRAPADSFASVQVHESALTNAAKGLELDGKRLTAAELQSLIREKIAHSSEVNPTTVEEDTVFEFADQDAVRFSVADQRLELILSLREVAHNGDPVRNFRVHAFFSPVTNGLQAEFVRDGALGIEGRIGTGERARMHGVFNKVLTEERRLPIVRLADPHDARLAGLMISQIVLEDGWIGLAIGPVYANRTAERTRMLR